MPANGPSFKIKIVHRIWFSTINQQTRSLSLACSTAWQIYRIRNYHYRAISISMSPC